MELTGIGPESPAPGRRRSVTRFMELSHVTPLHEHGDGSEVFHRTVLPPTASRNMISALLSSAMLEKETFD